MEDAKDACRLTREITRNQYKVVIPKADGSGAFGDRITNPAILEPNNGFTHSFLGIGGFNSELTANNALKYMSTKFFRSLLSILKVTQDMNADKMKYVPLQDFTSASDIDWSKSVPEIDQQFYKKYSLSPEETEFIETHVKEMD